MKSHYAFSLVEMISALSIAAILAAVAFPALHHAWYAFTRQLLQQQLQRSIHIARQEARIHHQNIVLCKSRNHHTCSGDWMNGQLIFVDEYNDGKVHEDKQIHYQSLLNIHRGTLHWRSFPLYRDYLLFSPLPLTQTANGTFWYCDEAESTPAFAIVVSQSGRSRVVYPDQDGEIKDGSGKMLTCTPHQQTSTASIPVTPRSPHAFKVNDPQR